jgi:tRNA threonylcarbamoyladenosine biosynthesis protein TsaB
MKLLALDSSSVACSVAVQVGEKIIERHEEQPREHTRLLMPMIESAIKEAGVKMPDLDAIVLGNGPGSFIGMRIAASVAQGLAFAADLKIIPVSSMAAVAAQVFAEEQATEVVVAQDAHMNEVYLGVYRQENAAVVDVVPERLHTADLPLDLDLDDAARRVAAGFGWQRYPALISANEKLVGTWSSIWHPSAQFLLELAVKADRIRPQDLTPAYLRQKVAEKPAQTR